MFAASSKKGGNTTRPASLYSIEYTPHPHEPDRIDDRIDDQYTEEDEDESFNGNLRSHGTLPGKVVFYFDCSAVVVFAVELKVFS